MWIFLNLLRNGFSLISSPPSNKSPGTDNFTTKLLQTYKEEITATLYKFLSKEKKGNISKLENKTFQVNFTHEHKCRNAK